MIPKKIHFVYITDKIPDKISYKIQGYINNWKRLLPDYEIIHWNRENFDINTIKWVKQAVETKKWAFAADYIRFWAVYNHGGIYFDTDVELLRPFGDELMDLPYFLGMEKTKGIINTATFGVEPKTEWVKDCLDYYENREFCLSKNKFDTLPVPYIMLKILKQKYGLKLIQSPSEFDKKIKEIQILPPKYFSPKRWNEPYAKVYECTRTVHNFDGSWSDVKNNLFRTLKNKAMDFIGDEFYIKIIFKLFGEK